MGSSNIVESEWLLDNTSSSTLELADGRKLGYAEYGDRNGEPIFYLHGWPASRIEGAGLGPAASKLGARIIAIDRPGFGWSSPHKNRTLLDHAQDVAALADHLRLDRYGVLGISGGGPYALACARALPSSRLRAVSIVCGLGSRDMGYSGQNWFHWVGWTFAGRMFPGLTRWFFSRETGARLDLSEEERMERLRQEFAKGKAKMDPKEIEMFNDPNFQLMHIRRSAEVYRQGMNAFTEDFLLLNSDFGFRIEDIRKDLPVQLWHGKLDTFVPPHHAEKVAARLGTLASLTISDDTHASIWWNRREDFLGGLVKNLKD